MRVAGSGTSAAAGEKPVWTIGPEDVSNSWPWTRRQVEQVNPADPTTSNSSGVIEQSELQLATALAKFVARESEVRRPLFTVAENEVNEASVKEKTPVKLGSRMLRGKVEGG